MPRMLRALSLAPLVALCACTFGATEVVVSLDTDAPLARALTIRATVADAAGAIGDAGTHQWTRGGPQSAIVLPASFAVIPGSGAAADTRVTLTIDATLGAGGPGEPAHTWRRVARFSFTPRAKTSLPVFLAVSCGNTAIGCTRVDASQCTVSQLCEEQGQTCGELGRCIGVDVMPVPTDGGVALPDVPAVDAFDGGFDATDGHDAIDAYDAIDVRDAIDATDVADATDVVDVTDVCMLTACGAACADLSRDPNHCGTCAQRCPIACSAGMCTRAVDVHSGSGHACAALADGTARCWGSNNWAELGSGDYMDRQAAEPVRRLVGAVEVGGGSIHSCARTAAGDVYCWGHDGFGELGDGMLSPPWVTASPTPMLTGVAQLATGHGYTCVRMTSDHTVRCFGIDDSGQLGNGTFSPTAMDPTPTMIVGGVGATIDVASGLDHTCAVQTGGRVFCWGSNGNGQIGDGTVAPVQPTPTMVAGITTAVQVAVGARHTCAVLADHTVRCWGANDGGQLGDGTNTESFLPVTVVGLTGAVQVTASTLHTCALDMAGAVFCWGDSTNGQLGDGTTMDHPTATRVATLPPIAQISAGSDFTCARTVAGGVMCWGDNTNGAIGDGTLGMDRLAPVAVQW